MNIANSYSVASVQNAGLKSEWCLIVHSTLLLDKEDGFFLFYSSELVNRCVFSTTRLLVKFAQVDNCL